MRHWFIEDQFSIKSIYKNLFESQKFNTDQFDSGQLLFKRVQEQTQWLILNPNYKFERQRSTFDQTTQGGETFDVENFGRKTLFECLISISQPHQPPVSAKKLEIRISTIKYLIRNNNYHIDFKKMRGSKTTGKVITTISYFLSKVCVCVYLRNYIFLNYLINLSKKEIMKKSIFSNI